MKAYIIHYNASDYPNKWIVVKWYYTIEGKMKRDAVVAIGDTKELVESTIRQGLTFKPREETDDLSIIGTWI